MVNYMREYSHNVSYFRNIITTFLWFRQIIMAFASVGLTDADVAKALEECKGDSSSYMCSPPCLEQQWAFCPATAYVDKLK